MSVTKVPILAFSDLKLGDYVRYTDRFGLRMRGRCVSQTGDQWIVSHGNRADTISDVDFLDAFRIDNPST